MSALSDPNAGLPHTHRSEEGRRLYMSALLKEKAKRAPRAILVGAVMWSTAGVEGWVCCVRSVLCERVLCEGRVCCVKRGCAV